MVSNGQSHLCIRVACGLLRDIEVDLACVVLLPTAFKHVAVVPGRVERFPKKQKLVYKVNHVLPRKILLLVRTTELDDEPIIAVVEALEARER